MICRKQGLVMPDIPLSSNNPLHSVGLHTLIRTLARYCTGGGGVLFNPAHLSGNISSILDYVSQNEVW
jgi:hypothetical protein